MANRLTNVFTKKEHVTSSVIHTVGYNYSTKILEIEFNNHTIYHYEDVPIADYIGLMEASSHGQFYNEKIKDQYSYIRLK